MCWLPGFVLVSGDTKKVKTQFSCTILSLGFWNLSLYLCWRLGRQESKCSWFSREGGFVNKSALRFLKGADRLPGIGTQGRSRGPCEPTNILFLEGPWQTPMYLEASNQGTKAWRLDHVRNNCTHYKCLSKGKKQKKKKRKERLGVQPGDETHNSEDLKICGRGLNSFWALPGGEPLTVTKSYRDMDFKLIFRRTANTSGAWTTERGRADTISVREKGSGHFLPRTWGKSSGGWVEPGTSKSLPSVGSPSSPLEFYYFYSDWIVLNRTDDTCPPVVSGRTVCPPMMTGDWAQRLGTWEFKPQEPIAAASDVSHHFERIMRTCVFRGLFITPWGQTQRCRSSKYEPVDFASMWQFRMNKGRELSKCKEAIWHFWSGITVSCQNHHQRTSLARSCFSHPLDSKL